MATNDTSEPAAGHLDAVRVAELKRVKLLATLVLVGTLALFVIARALLPLHPVFGVVAAFAEAGREVGVIK